MKTNNKKEKNIYRIASQVGKAVKPVGQIALGVIVIPVIKSISKLISFCLIGFEGGRMGGWRLLLSWRLWR